MYRKEKRMYMENASSFFRCVGEFMIYIISTNTALSGIDEFSLHIFFLFSPNQRKRRKSQGKISLFSLSLFLTTGCESLVCIVRRSIHCQSALLVHHDSRWCFVDSSSMHIFKCKIDWSKLPDIIVARMINKRNQQQQPQRLEWCQNAVKV